MQHYKFAIAIVNLMWFHSAFGQTYPTDIITSILTSNYFPIKSWQSIKFEAITKQKRDFSCGPAAISTLITSYLGGDINEEVVWKQIQTQSDDLQISAIEKNGASFYDLKKAVLALGYNAEGYRISVEELLKFKDPVVVHLNKLGFKHYSVFKGTYSGRVYLADSLRGNISLSLVDFQREWTGNILAVWQPGKVVLGTHSLSLHKNHLVDNDILEQSVVDSLQNPRSAELLIPKW